MYSHIANNNKKITINCKRNVQSTQEENYRTKKHGNTKGF